MVGFDEIVGHESIKEHFMDAVKYNKVSHAYIFDGPKGIGKKIMARAFAMTLQCEAGEKAPCGECHSCKQVKSGNHPDIIWLSHEKAQSIGVDDIREQLNSDIAIKPYSSKYKIYIMDDAQLLTVQAQNALLKTIEEPPAYAVIMLLTTNADVFLPTILSRCTVVNFKPVDTHLIERYLMANHSVPDYQASFCAQFAQGSLGKAIMLATEGDFEALKEDVLTVLKYKEDMPIHELVMAVKQAEKYKLNVQDYIDFMMLWYRDILMYKATKDVNRIVYRDEINDIKRQAEKISYENVNKVIDAMEKAKVRLKANVNFELAIELMMLTMKENS